VQELTLNTYNLTKAKRDVSSNGYSSQLSFHP